MKNFIKLNNIKKIFKLNSGNFTALQSTNLDIFEGETLGLVGESGSGKSTLGRLVSKIYNPNEGEILYKGKDIKLIPRIEFAKNFQMIFQDPYASLNPRMTIGDVIAEGLDIQSGKFFSNKSNKNRKDSVISLLNEVGMKEESINRFAHEFSGGQRQRIGIARALAVKPKFIVCDEPISALDVSIQAQIINLLKKLQKEHKLTYLFISHDLGMVKYISDRIAVMYKGRIVELGDTNEVISNPIHLYTKSLLNSIPSLDSKNSKSEREENLKKLDSIDFSKGVLQKVSDNHFVYQ